MGDEAVQREVAGLFMDQAVKVLKVMREAAHVSQRSDAAHQLKGSARAVGAWRVAEAAEVVERLAPDVTQDQLMEAMAGLHASVAEARAAIAAIIGDPAAGSL